MEFKTFDELIKHVQSNGNKKRVAVAAAHDSHALEALIMADNENVATPVLIGYKTQIQEILKTLGVAEDKYEIYETTSDKESAQKAIDLIKEGKADFIMKGKLQTADLLKAVVNKETGLSRGKAMSHIAMHEVPTYHKLLAVTDGGMMMYPTLEEKKQILENAVEIFNNIGYECPKVAVLTAVENVNPKMVETLDANELKQMNINGEIQNCIVEGPMSYDLAWSKESAEIKGFKSEVVGEADIMLVPNITTGNILGKSLIYAANAKMAGFIVGAKVPIVLTSRGASTQEKYLSLAISASAVK